MNKKEFDKAVSIIALIVMIALFALIIYRADAVIGNPCDYISKQSNGELMCAMNISRYECACNKFIERNTFEDFSDDLKQFIEEQNGTE